MPKILAIDTASTNCSVALSSAGAYSSRSNANARHAAQSILPMIEELLAESGCTLAQLDAIAVLAGPGSFTGIRIGIGIAQGLGMANATPVLPLSSLAVTAFGVLQGADASAVIVCTKARDDEVYFGAYRRAEDAGVELLGTEQVGTPTELLLAPVSRELLDSTLLVGDGWQQRTALEQALALRIPEQIVEPAPEIRDLVALATLRFALGEGVLPEQATPNYVKESMQYSR